MEKQLVFRGTDGYSGLEARLVSLGIRRLMLVCGRSLSHTPAGEFFASLTERTGIEVIPFSGFSPNPDYEDIVKGVTEFRQRGCDAFCGAGGGSAMDTAKCIKLFAAMPDDHPYTEQLIVPNTIPLIAIPTTAGTGSEATHFAVIYRNGEKLSVADESCLPGTVLLDAANLAGLPEIHRNASMLDALCHAIESLWSVRSTEESRELSRSAIGRILRNMPAYAAGDAACATEMLEAAYTAGQAINITTTTAAHAMSYKLTKLCGIPHGHAAALCLPEVYRFLSENTDRCTDSRGTSQLRHILGELPALLGCESYEAALSFLSGLPAGLGLAPPPQATEEELELLAASVNTQRLSNSPVIPDRGEIREMYIRILRRN